MGNQWLTSPKRIFTVMESRENTKASKDPSETHTHTHTQTICTGQDTASASFSAHLLEGKSSLEAVIWHQHSKSDTIYHRALNMETFITSWQENLVENNHLGFDNNLAPSFAPHLDSVLFGYAILYLWPLFIYIYSTCSHIIICCNNFTFKVLGCLYYKIISILEIPDTEKAVCQL